MVICLYVDDMLVTKSKLEAIAEFKSQMLSEFEMSDLGRLNYFLGIEFQFTKSGTIMHQMKYTQDLLSKFGMRDCNVVVTPVEMGLKLGRSVKEEDVDQT